MRIQVGYLPNETPARIEKIMKTTEKQRVFYPVKCSPVAQEIGVEKGPRNTALYSPSLKVDSVVVKRAQRTSCGWDW